MVLIPVEHDKEPENIVSVEVLKLVKKFKNSIISPVITGGNLKLRLLPVNIDQSNPNFSQTFGSTVVLSSPLKKVGLI